MGNKKLGYFEVKKKTNKFLNWSLIGFLILEALVELGDFIGLARVSNGPLVYGISRITQSGVGHVLLTLVTTGFFIFIWEWFRRSLKGVGSKLWYVVLALITLIGCNALLSLAPDGYSTFAQIQHPSRFSTFSSNFILVSNGVQNLLKIILSIGLIIYYRGRIRTFAWLTLASVLLIGDGTYIYNYLYTSGVDMANQSLAFGFAAFMYLMVVLPVIFLRRCMTYTHVKSANGDSDIN